MNQVLVTGRLSAPSIRTLADGATLVTFRIIVSGPDGRVDTLECASTKQAVIEKASRYADVDVEASGSLRRTFWRAGAGVASRTSIDVRTLKRRPS